MKRSKIKLLTTTLLCTLTISSVTIPGVKSPIITAYAAESSVASASISEILSNQQSDGGWRKNYKTTSGDWAKSTIDNDATYTEIRKLAAEYAKTKDSKYSDAVIKGINFLINMQYDNGGWPQVYKGTGYHAAITYNDNAMVNVLYLLDEVSNKKGDFAFVDSSLANKAKTSVDKGVQCILDTQVVSNGVLTVWGQQHDKDTLKPTSARAYELPSLCSSESAAIVKFLATRKATPEINKSIAAAVKWFNDSKITGIDVVKSDGDTVVKENSSSKTVYWARFYELETNKPLFSGRDGVKKYNLSDIEKERRAGYAWYGTWGKNVVDIKVTSNQSATISDSSSNTSSNDISSSKDTLSNDKNTSNNVSQDNAPKNDTTVNDNESVNEDLSEEETIVSEAHNFTENGLDSSFFNISGNLSTKKGTVEYNGMSLSQCLKMQLLTKITFETTEDSTLTLVFNSDFNKKVKIDGENYTAKDGIVTVHLKAGSHTIKKKNTGNLYYIGLSN